jgi:hypothetical protein
MGYETIFAAILAALFPQELTVALHQPPRRGVGEPREIGPIRASRRIQTAARAM